MSFLTSCSFHPSADSQFAIEHKQETVQAGLKPLSSLHCPGELVTPAHLSADSQRQRCIDAAVVASLRGRECRLGFEVRKWPRLAAFKPVAVVKLRRSSVRFVRRALLTDTYAVSRPAFSGLQASREVVSLRSGAVSRSQYAGSQGNNPENHTMVSATPSKPRKGGMRSL